MRLQVFLELQANIGNQIHIIVLKSCRTTSSK